MRPGSLTRQYKDPQHHTRAYWQISYTGQMKRRTEYVRQESVKAFRRQIATHKRFKRLVDEWIELSIEHSRLTIEIAGPGATRKAGTWYSQVRKAGAGGHYGLAFRSFTDRKGGSFAGHPAPRPQPLPVENPIRD